LFEGDLCWQYQVKLRQLAEIDSSGEPDSLGVNDVAVEAISYGAAKEFIEQYEWLGNVGSAQIFYGLKRNRELLSAVCFTRPTSNVSLRKQLKGVGGLSVFQLCRGATAPNAPKWAASFLISNALKLLARERRVCVVVAYADPRAGEVGVVYQSANAIYLGEMESRGPGQYVINGRSYHPRTVHRLFGSARHDVLVRVDPDYLRIQRTKKHRYVFVTATGVRRKAILRALTPSIRQHPKRRARKDKEADA
jgi:hypothetical protein